MSVEERCGVVVGGEVRDGHCFDFDFKLDVLINKHGSFGRYDRLLARGFPAARYGWPQLYLLALCPIDLQQIGGFFTRRVLYLFACINLSHSHLVYVQWDILPLFTALQIRDHAPISISSHDSPHSSHRDMNV